MLIILIIITLSKKIHHAHAWRVYYEIVDASVSDRRHEGNKWTICYWHKAWLKHLSNWQHNFQSDHTHSHFVLTRDFKSLWAIILTVTVPCARNLFLWRCSFRFYSFEIRFILNEWPNNEWILQTTCDSDKLFYIFYGFFPGQFKIIFHSS